MLISRLLNFRSMSTNSLPRIRNAAIMVIGDEILNGKIKDTNSHHFAQYCFELGVDLQHISVVPDEESVIVETLKQLRSKFDFIVTSGGIGPTHDDKTYESIAQAYHLPLRLDDETVEKMNELSLHPPKNKPKGSSELKAQLRMARFPFGSSVHHHFVVSELWVPVVSVENKVYIFPGIPSLFKQLLEGLRPHIVERVSAPKLARKYVSTTTPESKMASILGEIHNRFQSKNVKIGSYPHFNDKRNTVSIIGPDEAILNEIVKEVMPQLENSHEITAADESRSS